VDLLRENKTNKLQVDNGDYVGTLGVYHHLHCLNNLRRFVHWEYREKHGILEAFSAAHSSMNTIQNT
jgi:hypothetical protein